MKKLYSTIMLLAMMVAALSFTACGDDDDDFDDYSLIGTWECVKVEGWAKKNTVHTYLQLRKDGTYILINDHGRGGTIIEKGAWKVTGNLFVRTYNDSKLGQTTATYDIIEIKSDRFVVSVIGNTGYYDRISDTVIKKYL